MLRQLDEARSVKDWARANSIQDRLRPMGVNTSLRWAHMPPKRCSSRVDGDSSAPWAKNLRYDLNWSARLSDKRFLSPDTLMASTLGWQHAPRLGRFKAIPKAERFAVGERLGANLRSMLLASANEKNTLCVEKVFLQGFLAGICGDAGDVSVLPPFVLFLVNGGDQPVTSAQCELLEKRLSPALSMCFATNLFTSPNPALFRPLPLGVMPNNKAESELLIEIIRNQALPWEQRDRRLLITPMALNSRARRDFLRVLAQPEFSDLVLIVAGPRLSLEDFFTLLGRHKSALSPPGGGFDCFRTWQALALGTVPLIVFDSNYDHRLFANTGARQCPFANDLTRAALVEVLESLTDPADKADCLLLEEWTKGGRIPSLEKEPATTPTPNFAVHQHVRLGAESLLRTWDVAAGNKARLFVPLFAFITCFLLCASFYSLDPGVCF